MSGDEYDYEVLIDDLDVELADLDEPASLWTKASIQQAINRAIRERPEDTRTPKGLELEVSQEWRDILSADGSILWDYKKLGWKVMWYNTHSLGPGRGKLLRSWLSFRDQNFISEE